MVTAGRRLVTTGLILLAGVWLSIFPGTYIVGWVVRWTISPQSPYRYSENYGLGILIFVVWMLVHFVAIVCLVFGSVMLGIARVRNDPSFGARESSRLWAGTFLSVVTIMFFWLAFAR